MDYIVKGGIRVGFERLRRLNEFCMISRMENVINIRYWRRKCRNDTVLEKFDRGIAKYE